MPSHPLTDEERERAREVRAAFRGGPPEHVDCKGCIRRGVADPATVRPGYQCNECADLEEGPF